MDGDKPGEPDSGSAWRLATVGMELAGSVLGGCLLGYWVDREFGTGRWGLIIGAGIGIVGGLYNMIRRAVHESLGVSGVRRPKAAEKRASPDRESEPPEAGSA